MRIFFAGPPICFVMVILLFVSPGSCCADLYEYFKVSSEPQILLPEDLPPEIEFAAEIGIAPEIGFAVFDEPRNWQDGLGGDIELIGIPNTIPEALTHAFRRPAVGNLVLVKNEVSISGSPAKLATHSSMPIFVKKGGRSASHPFHIMSFETVDQEIKQNFWEPADLDSWKIQVDDLFLKPLAGDQAEDTSNRKSQSSWANSSSPTNWVYLGLIALCIACLRRFRMST